MALIHSFEKSGNLLFKYRGQIPLLVFIFALPFLALTNQTGYQFLFSADGRTCYFVLIAFAILVSLVGIIIRAYTIGTTPRGTSGRNTDKQVAKQLNTTGIYAIVRHPLYLANYLMWAGLLIFTMNIYIFLFVSLIYWLYYERIMFAEERFLESQFGQEYIDWSMNVPAFLPAFSKFTKSSIPFSFKSVLRREYTTLFSITLAYTLVDYYINVIIYNLAVYNTLSIQMCVGQSWIRPSLYVLGIVLVIMIVLRSLKHHSKLLQRDENRD